MATITYAGNPVKKRGATKSKAPKKKKPVARRRGASRIGRGSVQKMATEALIGGAVGAFGALASNAVLAKIPRTPGSFLGNDNVRRALGAGIAVGLGIAAGKVIKKPAIGAGIATGAASVAIYSLAAPVVSKSLNLTLEGDAQSLLSADLLGFYSPGPNFTRPQPMVRGGNTYRLPPR